MCTKRNIDIESTTGNNDIQSHSFATENLNSPDGFGHVPLHAAVLKNSITLLDFLLKQPNIDRNYKNEDGRTPLMMSIKLYRNAVFVIHLIKAGCDVNICDKYKETPMHAAASHPSADIAYELIKKGADINAQDQDMTTPLHFAVNSRNLEALCMLLYYGADVNLIDRNKMTPLLYAAPMDSPDIGEMLIGYYEGDGLSHASVCGITALHAAAQQKTSLAISLVQAGANVNYVTSYGRNVLELSMYYKTARLFKLIWARFDHTVLLDCKEPFLLKYIEYCSFSGSEWAECLQLILESPIAFKFVHQYFVYNDVMKDDFLQCVLQVFYALEIRRQDRLKLIYTSIYAGIKVNIDTIKTVYELYGFGEELEILIYAVNEPDLSDYSKFNFLLLPFILGLEENSGAQTVYQLHNYITHVSNIISVFSRLDDVTNAMGFFSRKFYRKLVNANSGSSVFHQPAVCKKLEVVPEIPTLVELSRDETRKFIRQTCKIERIYQFHDVVKSFAIPQKLKDILRFKMPLYY